MYGNHGNRLQEVNRELLAKVHLAGRQARFGRPRESANPLVGPLATAFSQSTDRWVGFLVLIISRHCMLVCLVVWAHLVSVMRDVIFM
jgi:hypothetical protein